MCIYKVCNGVKIKDFRQIKTCHQVSLVVNLFKKVTFKVFIFLQYILETVAKNGCRALYR